MAKKKATARQVQKNDVLPLSPDVLFFDLKNPRLVETSLVSDSDEVEILRVLWREMAVEEIAMSIAANGFYAHEVLYAERKSDDHYVVIEGNRRLAAVKLLLDSKLQRTVKAKLPGISASVRKTLRELPVVLTTRRKIWQYVGFKHVNGPRPWGAWSKAHYIAEVHNTYNEPLEEISRKIGDQHATVSRLYRGLMVLQQAEDHGVWNRSDRWNKRLYFSHLYTGLSYEGFQGYLGLKEKTSYKPNPVRGKSNLGNLGDLCTWLFGSKSLDVRPLIRSQNPDLKRLDTTLKTDRGIDALRSGMPLDVALDVGLGDERLFRESLTQAKIFLQKAAGTLHTGYDGLSDLHEMGQDVYKLSGRMLDDMDDVRSISGKRGRRSRRRPSR